jgi:HEAT repeat protein
MKNKSLIWGIVVILALVAVAVFIIPENRGMVTSIFTSKNSFGGKSKSDWLKDLGSSKFSARSKAHGDLVYQEGGDNAVPILVDGLKSDSSQVRAECADILGSYRVHGKAAIQPLVESLKDPAPEVKVKASDSLQKLAPDSKVAIPTLTAMLKDPEKEVRLHAAGCLGSFGPDAKSAWQDLAKLHKEEKDPNVSGQIARAMYAIDKVAAEKEGAEKPVDIHVIGGPQAK